MQTTIFYVFEPTVALSSLATLAGQDYLSQSAVWIVREHDRVGAQYSKAEISRAHWTQFVANLVGAEDAPAELAELKEQCLSLGLEGCWTIFETKVGGDAKELMDDAQATETFLVERGVVLP